MADETTTTTEKKLIKFEKVTGTPDVDIIFRNVIGLKKITGVDREELSKRVTSIEVLDVRLLKHLLTHIQMMEGKGCTTLELVTIDVGVEGFRKIIGFRTKAQTGIRPDEIYVIAPTWGHHEEKSGLKKKFKDVPKKLYVQLPMYDESLPKAGKKDVTTSRFAFIGEALEINEAEEVDADGSGS